MSTIKDGGPAFPVADWDHQTFAPKTIEETRRLLSGMSLRDYFAGKAMEAMLAGHFSHYGHENYWPRTEVAEEAYGMADAMLKARECGAA